MVFLFDKQCKITDFERIILIQNDRVIVKMKKKKITIKGEFLKLSYYSKEEILITGEIIMVQFEK